MIPKFLIDLYCKMEQHAASDMGELTRSQAALFHTATDAIERLIDCIDADEEGKNDAA